MAKRKLTPLEEFNKKATEAGLSYGKYSQLLYKEECERLRMKEAKKRAKSRKASK